MAVRVGFEPTEPVKVQRFSRPPDSTALAPHRFRILPFRRNSDQTVAKQVCSSNRQLSLLCQYDSPGARSRTARVFASRFVRACRMVTLMAEGPDSSFTGTRSGQRASVATRTNAACQVTSSSPALRQAFPRPSHRCFPLATRLRVIQMVSDLGLLAEYGETLRPQVVKVAVMDDSSETEVAKAAPVAIVVLGSAPARNELV
jgi:hypothetical protein